MNGAVASVDDRMSLHQRLRARMRWDGRLIVGVWIFGIVIRFIDLLAVRPLCGPNPTSVEHCFPFASDPAALFGAAQLGAHGDVGYNPVFYALSGGGLAPTAAKPPVVVGLMIAIAWIGSAALWQVIAVCAAVLWAIWTGVSKAFGRLAAQRTVQVVSGVFVLTRILGGESAVTARVVTSIVASCSIPLMMLVGKRLGGPAVGAITGVLVAVSPLIFVNDTMLNVEVAVAFALPLLALAYLHAWDHPGRTSAMMFGFVAALAILSRFELLATVGLLSVAYAWRSRRALRNGLIQMGTAALTTIVILVPYFGWSASRTQTSTGGALTPFGLVLSQGACDEAYFGQARGYYHPCFVAPRTKTFTAATTAGAAVDEITGVAGYGAQLLSPDNPTRTLFAQPAPRDVFDGQVDVERYRQGYVSTYGQAPDGQLGLGVWINGAVATDANAPVRPGDEVRFVVNVYYLMSDELPTSRVLELMSRRYIGDHLSDLPSVIVTRWGRMLGVYRIGDTVTKNAVIEYQGRLYTWSGMVVFWISLLLAPVGVAALRRARNRRGASAPPIYWEVIWAPIVQTFIVVAATYGILRYRLSFDLMLCVPAAAGVVALLDRVRTSNGPAATPIDRPSERLPQENVT